MKQWFSTHHRETFFSFSSMFSSAFCACVFLCVMKTMCGIKISVGLSSLSLCLQCFDAVGWAAGRASGL